MLFILLFACESIGLFGGEGKERSGEQVYQTFCIHCHQANGQGVATRYPPLANSQWLKGDIPIKIILHGLKGPVEVSGETYNNVMAPWENVLTDHEIAGVINFIRGSWGNESLYATDVPITKERVKMIRAKYRGASNWTIEEALKSE